MRRGGPRGAHGARQGRVDGCAHLLCQSIADRLGDRVRLRLREPIHAIDRSGDDLVVQSISDIDGARSEYLAERVVVGVPPRLAQAIEYRPALDAPRATAA